MEFNAPRAGSAPAYVTPPQGGDPYRQAYGGYMGQDPQMFGSAFSGPPGPSDGPHAQ
jgi:hypothetical protein